jgi:F-type H+-transporting ATPase subunit epsilon
MANPMRIELVSPEKILFSGEATMVITRTLGGGDIAFMAGHAPFLAALTECHTRIHLADGGVQDVAVHGGFVQVAANKVSILSDVAELSADIDVARAQRAHDAAEAALGSDATDEEAASALRRATARLGAAAGAGVAAGAARAGH